MRSKVATFVAVMSSALSFHLCAADALQSKVELGQGYRHDSLRFNFGGIHNKPNILSELDFKNMQVYLTTLKSSLSNGTYIGVIDLAYGDIIHGKVRDSDYFKNNRHGEFSRSYLKVRGNYTVDASAKIGRIIPMFSGITCTPSIGYGAFWQHIRFKDGHQTIPRHFKIHNVNSTVKTLWSAPFADLRFSVPLSARLTLGLGYTFFYPVQYTGKGHWNLRHMHFTQKNKAGKSYANKGDVSLRWAFAERFELGLGASIAQFCAKGGKIHLKLPNFKSHQPAHRAKRTCADYVLSLSYSF